MTLVTGWRMDGRGLRVNVERQIKWMLQYFRREMTTSWTRVIAAKVGEVDRYETDVRSCPNYCSMH